MSEPFSRIVRVDSIPSGGKTVAIEASPTEREALAALYRLPSIEALSAELTLKRSAQDEVRVKGAVHGRLTQTCVVSLEPFPAVVDEEVDVRFAELADDVAARRLSNEPQTFSIDDEDEPDPIIEGRIDLGALAAEFFALGLDPYPRKPGAAFEAPQDREDAASPFSALAGRASKKPD
jgi:Large ribosomal RNA subunit accumulation protein YceD